MAQAAENPARDAGAASVKKSSSKPDRQPGQTASHEPATAGAEAQEAIAQAGATMWENSFAFGAEAARFAARRADRYREYYEDLAGCRNPAEAGQAAARAAQAAMQDYLDEFGRMGQMAVNSDPEGSPAHASTRK